MQYFRHQTTDINQRGFTLVEVMVSLSLFMVVVTVSVGTMLVLIDANKKAQTVEALINNVTISLDSMTREIRKGYDYQCGAVGDLTLTGNTVVPNGCPSGGAAFAFTESGGSLTADCPADNDRVAYRRFEEAGNGYIERNVCNQGWEKVTAPEINVTGLSFSLLYEDPGDDEPPLVNVLVTGEAGEYDLVETNFALQTTVTQRLLDTEN